MNTPTQSPQQVHLVMMSPEDIASAVETAVAKAMAQKEHEEVYISLAEAAKRLGVSRPTLWRWHESGYLTKIYRGKKVTYRQSDVDRIIRGEVK